MDTFDSTTLIAIEYGHALKEAKFVLRIRRYDNVDMPSWRGAMFTMVIVRDLDRGFERNIIEGTLRTEDFPRIFEAYSVVAEQEIHTVPWSDFPAEVQHYVRFNILPREWHDSDDEFIGVRVTAYTARPDGVLEMPYDCYDDPKWLAENGYPDEAADLLRARQESGS